MQPQELDEDDIDDVVEFVKRTKPVACHAVMRNLAHKSPDEHIAMIANHLKIAAKSHPYLRFLDARRLSPTEDYMFQIMPKEANKRKFDMAETCSYLIELRYSYDGIDLDPAIISMFYTRQAGWTVLFGSNYHVVTVLQARPITGEKNSVFVKLPMDLFSVKTMTYGIEVDGYLVGGNLRHAKIHHFNTTTSRRNLNNGLVHYLLAKHGFAGMCERYLQFVPHLGKAADLRKKYNKKNYVIVASSKFIPKTVVKQHWEPNDIAFAIPRDKYSAFVRDMLTGVLYITDHFYRTEINSFNSPDFWLDKLAFCILPDDTINKPKDRWLKIKSHIDSLDRYMSTEQQQIMREEYRDDPKYNNVVTFFDLLAYVIDSYSDHLHTANTGSVYEMRLDTTANLLAPITHRGTRLIYELESAEANNGGLPIRQQDVQKIIKSEFNARTIFKIRNKNQAIVPASATSACYFPKITSLVATPKIPPPLFNVNMLVIADHMSMAKSNLDARSRANPYAQVDPVTGIYMPPPELKEWALAAQNYIELAKVQAKEIDNTEQDPSEVSAFTDNEEPSEDEPDSDDE